MVWCAGCRVCCAALEVGYAVDKIVVARGGLRAGGGPAAGYFFLLRQKEVTKKKATADYCPSGSQTASAGRGKHANSLRSDMRVSDPPPALTFWQQSQAEFRSEKQSPEV